jgi:hypothetical protein
VPAVITAGVRKDAALQILGKRLTHVRLECVVIALPIELARTGQIKPRLIVLGNGLVQQRSLRVARVVELGLGDVHAAMPC